MARETKAQRNAREAQEREERLEQDRREYFPNLMATLERATKNHFEVMVKNGFFLVRNPNASELFTLSPEFSNESWDLQCLNYALEEHEAAEREAERRFMLKQAALAKLTKEEREVLNLSANW